MGRYGGYTWSDMENQMERIMENELETGMK